jgi:hypothetical protein
MRWSSRWDQQHDSVVLMVDSIYGQGFAYAHKVEEERRKKVVKLGLHAREKKQQNSTAADQKSVPHASW